MAKKKGMGLCVMCDKRLTLANTRHQRRTPEDEGPCRCDGCEHVLGTELGQVLSVYDWRNGCYREWVALTEVDLTDLHGNTSPRIGIRHHTDAGLCGAPFVHYAWWTGNRWEEGPF